MRHKHLLNLLFSAAFGQLAQLLRRQYHLPPLRSYLTAYRAARAAVTFQAGHARTDYEHLHRYGRRTGTAVTLRLRQALAKEQLELERFYATAPIGLGFLDIELRYLRVNERLAQIHGAPVADHIGRRLDEMAAEFAASIEATCREVIGTGIAVRTAPGKGTTFTILLPAAIATVRRDAPAIPAQAGSKETGVILVVDDEVAVRKLAQRALERQGYQVLVAEDGQAAIEMAAQHPEISAAVLDLAMPVMSGDTAAIAMKTQRPDLPLILSSGYAESEASERFGADLIAGFLQKPYTTRMLVAKVAEAMKKQV